MKKNFFVLSALIISFPVFSQWTQITSGQTADYDGIGFIDGSKGCIGGGLGAVTLITTNGGDSWTSTGDPGYRSYSFVNSTTGYAAGIVGNSMAKTTDGGSSWTALTPPTSNSLWGVAATSTTTAHFCGTGGVYWYTTNGGATLQVGSSGVTSL